MTCYFRHLQPIFEEAGIETTKENKTELDMAIHRIVGVRYKNCPATWKEVKRRLREDEAGFISELRGAWAKRRA